MKKDILTPEQFTKVLEDAECNFSCVYDPYSYLYSEYSKERNLNENYFKKLHGGSGLAKLPVEDTRTTGEPPSKKKYQPNTKVLVEPQPSPEYFPDFSFYLNNTNIYPTTTNNPDLHKCYLWIDSTGHCSKCGNKL